MSRNLTPEPVATGSAETRIGQLRWREYGGPRE
ncbi:alpha/beta hydrolase, partial [Candidatus Saccharibacteria bacterium]|nr:alpha/beta hydrolase [Candidatus Saccharibacteria bacterium]